MNEGRDEQSDSTPVTLALKIHLACKEFAQAWRAGDEPRIEAFLDRLPSPERSPALRELLRQELVLRRAAGESIDADQYYRRFPHDMEILTSVFAAPSAPEPGLIDVKIGISLTPAGGATKSLGTELTGEAPMPQHVDRYDILRPIGRGGYGVVYLAYDTQLKRRVALKMPLSHRFQSPLDEQAFIEEAQNAAQLDHPGIVRVYDVRVADTGPFIVQQYVAGENLNAVLKSQRMTPPRIAQLLIDVCAALGHAHQQGFVHRDLKPGNILVHSDGKPYIADFGLAVHESAQQQRKGQVAGTWAYMSPEQLRGESHRLDGRSDIWSLGIILYEVLSGRRPFTGDSAETLCADIQERDPRPPRQIDPEIPTELERICMKCLAKRAAQRYSTAGDLADDLRHWLESTTAIGDRAAESRAAKQPDVRIIPRGLRAFGAEDADFYLELFPGPRDRSGLPDTLRFWKTRVEETDPDATFPVGLMYGPSGCGKSSLLRAGLLPRLASHVVPLYVEATGSETETRLLAIFRHNCPGIPIDVSLPQLFAGIREGVWKRDGVKWLVVLDQFEQWLHAHGADDHSELAHALRQCDGGRLQCLCLLRDDFWVAISRFMQGLEIELVEGHNTGMVDLFDPLHARHVLARFGAAYGRLPSPAESLPKEQERFLDRAVEGLAQDGKVVCVRLALFAEMMKGRPWTLASLEAVGGTEGLGVTFLEETFCARGAPPAHRLHQAAARQVLQALLPGQGIDIKGQMQHSETLLDRSGYARRPDDFATLINILDRDVRLITPTEPPHLDQPADEATVTERGKYYQLTHDYLVPSLRRWLARKQRESWRGRAEARLAEHADLWNANPDNRFLLRWWEHLDICTFVRRKAWTAPQRRMMRQSAIYHTARGALLLAVLLVLGWIGWDSVGSLRATALTDELLSADTSQVPYITAKMASQRRWVDPRLRTAQHELQARLDAATPQTDTTEIARRLLHVSLALAPTDPTQLPYLGRRLLEGEPSQMSVFREMLEPYRNDLTSDLWRVVEQGGGAHEGQLLRAASVLAAFAPNDLERWQRAGTQVVDHLVAVPTTHLPYWMELLRPVRRSLLPRLLSVYQDRQRSAAERKLATDLLVYYAADMPEVLARAIQYADEDEFEVLLPLLHAHTTRATAILNATIQEEPAADSLDGPVSEALRESLAKRQASAAVALLRIGRPAAAWTVLEHTPDPRARSMLIHLCASLNVDPGLLIEQLDRAESATVRQALCLCLGQYASDRLAGNLRDRILARAWQIYRDDPDPGLHAAAQWLLGKLGQHDDALGVALTLAETEAALNARATADRRRWYITSQGQTMVLIRGGRFLMGSPATDPDREEDEILHEKQISRTFAMAATETTLAQYARFQQENAGLEMDLVNHPELRRVVRGDEAPIAGLTWYEAAAYCNWLSQKEGIPEDQWCYERNAEDRFGPGMRARPNYLSLTGYRLPTGAEWEYASRGGATTVRCYGHTPDLLHQYAWYSDNAQRVSSPVALLKPNDYGLFDMYGNVWEWCHDLRDNYAGSLEDVEGCLPVQENEGRVLRGGSYQENAYGLRSADRNADPPESRNARYGFRVTRTCPPSLR